MICHLKQSTSLAAGLESISLAEREEEEEPVAAHTEPARSKFVLLTSSARAQVGEERRGRNQELRKKSDMRKIR